MGVQNLLWSTVKKSLTAGLIGITVSDRYVSIAPVRGGSMSPTLNPIPKSFSDDYVLVEKLCLDKYKFSRGDVVVYSSPSNHKERHIKRIIALPGDYIHNPFAYDVVKVPEGHCWIEGDNAASSLDSRSIGPELPQEQQALAALATARAIVTQLKTEMSLLLHMLITKITPKPLSLYQISISHNAIPLGLVRGRVTHVIWPPQRISKVEKRYPEKRLMPDFTY